MPGPRGPLLYLGPCYIKWFSRKCYILKNLHQKSNNQIFFASKVANKLSRVNHVNKKEKHWLRNRSFCSKHLTIIVDSQHTLIEKNDKKIRIQHSEIFFQSQLIKNVKLQGPLHCISSLNMLKRNICFEKIENLIIKMAIFDTVAWILLNLAAKCVIFENSHHDGT